MGFIFSVNYCQDCKYKTRCITVYLKSTKNWRILCKSCVLKRALKFIDRGK